MAVTKNATCHAHDAAKAALPAIKELPGVKGSADRFEISWRDDLGVLLTEEECMTARYPRDCVGVNRKTCGLMR